jgi:HNH endonuclease
MTKRYTCKFCGTTGAPSQVKMHELFCNPEAQQARFWAKVEKRGPEECWLWKGQLRWDGYGRFLIMRKPTWTHRYSWELHNSRKIPKDMGVLHSCHNPACVNPKHLRIGTHKENMEEAHRVGRWMESLSIAKAVAK